MRLCVKLLYIHVEQLRSDFNQSIVMKYPGLNLYLEFHKSVGTLLFSIDYNLPYIKEKYMQTIVYP